MSRSSVCRRLLRYLRPYLWPHFTLAMVSMLLFSASNGAIPLLVRHVFDDVLTSRDARMFSTLPFLFLAIFAVRGLGEFGSAYLGEYVGERIVADMRNDLHRHLQRLSLTFFNKTPTGDIVSRAMNDMVMVRFALTRSVAALLTDVSSLAILTAVACYQDWRLSIVALIVLPVSVLPIVRLSKRSRMLFGKAHVSMSRLTALLTESVQGNRVVKAFGMEDYEHRRFAAESGTLFRLHMRGTIAGAVVNPILQVFAALGIAGVIWYGGHRVVVGRSSQGAPLAFLAALFLLYEPLQRIAKTNTLIQQAFGGAERVVALLDTRPEIVDRPGARELREIRDGIRFERVGFRYDRDPVLRDIDLEVRLGEVVALVGESGAGKSTLADLIPRFYDVLEGRITIDGQDVRGYTIASLRANIGIVTQHTFLFDDTIRANIAYGDISKGADAIVAAARATHAHDFIMRLPQGYDTVIGEQGVKLSGGERQRLAIARALLKDAPLLLLDEATSALDNESERLVQSALQRLMYHRTTLVIAHRLSTIRRATRIVLLHRGRIVEQGTHDELLALNAGYRKLHELSFSDLGR